jgi:hypothetical protein
MAFKKATKQNATIKLAISGPSGSGKTFSALRLAKGLGGKTALLDTEYGSASLYADKFEFDTWDDQDPSGFPPEYFIRVIKAAEEAGYNNLIIDSLTHEWSGRGGCLDLADAVARTKCKGNTYTAWKEITPRHDKLIETIVGAKINIIATMRSKTEYVLNKDERTGKSTPQKVGMGTVQRDGMDYEFTLMFELDRDSHLASAGKDRTCLFSDPSLITEDTGKKILAWLNKTPDTKSEQPKQQAQAPQAQQPKTEKKVEKKDPTPYIQADIDTRVANGEDLETILTDYADILKTDMVRELQELNDAERSIVARELFIRNRNNKE